MPRRIRSKQARSAPVRCALASERAAVRDAEHRVHAADTGRSGPRSGCGRRAVPARTGAGGLPKRQNHRTRGFRVPRCRGREGGTGARRCPDGGGCCGLCRLSAHPRRRRLAGAPPQRRRHLVSRSGRHRGRPAHVPGEGSVGQWHRPSRARRPGRCAGPTCPDRDGAASPARPCSMRWPSGWRPAPVPAGVALALLNRA